ncbi:transmembrane emp24 domain-containing protein 1a [Salarias fasciatus]|nr:transmembrane emp24 domain-containing protein 1-like [Salarias fasciatus]
MAAAAAALVCLLTCFSLAAGLSLGLGPKQQIEFTFVLPAGNTECFFQTAKQSDTLEVEYQVIAGSGLDVGFTLISPGGHRLVSDFRRSEGIHMVDPMEDGDYRLCFDNSFSKLSEKMVFFEVIVNSQSSSDAAADEWADVAVAESVAEYRLEDLRARLESVYRQLEKSRQVLATLRALEARDRYLLEDNLWRVSFWSCMNLLVIATVAVTQIYSLRRLFDNTKRVRT